MLGTGGPTSLPKPTRRPPLCTASQPVLRARLSRDPPSLWLPGPRLLSATLVTTSSPLLPFSDLLPLTSGGPGPLSPQPLPLIPSFSRTLKPSHGLILFALPPEFSQSLGPSPLLRPPGPGPLSSHLDLQTASRPLHICSQTQPEPWEASHTRASAAQDPVQPGVSGSREAPRGSARPAVNRRASDLASCFSGPPSRPGPSLHPPGTYTPGPLLCLETPADIHITHLL